MFFFSMVIFPPSQSQNYQTEKNNSALLKALTSREKYSEFFSLLPTSVLDLIVMVFARVLLYIFV